MANFIVIMATMVQLQLHLLPGPQSQEKQYTLLVTQ